MQKKLLPFLLVVFIVFLFVMLYLFRSCGKNSGTEVTSDLSTADASGSVILEDRDGSSALNPAQTNTGSEETDDIGKQDNTSNLAENFVMPESGVRPYAIMIDNQGTICLPQGGLDRAQIIYEVIVEGGITRLMPIFWNVDPELIGPVRSSRHYFLDYAMEFDAIYVHFGWSPQAMTDIPKFKINNINGVANGGGIFWDLTKDRGNWQDSYTSMEKIKEYVKKAGYKTTTGKSPVFTYNCDGVQAINGETAENISIKYSVSYNCSYKYDSITGLYKRFRDGVSHIERTTGKQLAAKNIIIQSVKNYTIKGDDSGRQELNTAASGSGIFITNGKSQKIKWSKASRTAPTKYVYENGTAVVLNPGQTWIQIIPFNAKVAIE